MGWAVYLEVIKPVSCINCGKQYGYEEVCSTEDIEKPYALCDIINKFINAGKITKSFDRLIMDRETFWSIRKEYTLSFLKNPEIAERYQHKQILTAFNLIDTNLDEENDFKIAYH